MIYVVTSDENPPCFFKGNTEEDVEKTFFQGMSKETADRIKNDDSFMVRPLDMELLEELAPDEFILDGDVAF